MLIAAMPSAPPRFAASATSHISPIFGVIFASIGSVEPVSLPDNIFLPAPGFARHRYPSHEKSFADRRSYTRSYPRQLLAPGAPAPPIAAHFPHDRSDQYFVRVIFLQPTQGGQILFQRMFSNLLHIFEADKTGIFFHQMIKTRRDFVGDKKPIVLNTTPPQPVS